MLVVTLILHRKLGFCKARTADFDRIVSVYTSPVGRGPGNLDPAGLVEGLDRGQLERRLSGSFRSCRAVSAVVLIRARRGSQPELDRQLPVEIPGLVVLRVGLEPRERITQQGKSVAIANRQQPG